MNGDVAPDSMYATCFRDDKDCAMKTLRSIVCVLFVPTMLVATLAAGCGPGGSGEDDEETNTNASSSEVTTCKEACQRQKFFECYDAQQHATCFDKCERAESSQIETFAACVGSDTCDEECSLNVELDDGGDGDDGGDNTSECVSSCQALKSDSCGQFGMVDCEGACGQMNQSERDALIYCEGARDGCEFSEECSAAADGGAAQSCKFACRQMGQFDCIPSSDVSTCESRCDEISSDEAEGFASCVQSGICDDDSCYEQISEGGASADVSGCQTTCDEMREGECLSATQHSECRSVCEDASSSAIESFKACEDPTSFCENDTCYQTFQENTDGG